MKLKRQCICILTRTSNLGWQVKMWKSGCSVVGFGRGIPQRESGESGHDLSVDFVFESLVTYPPPLIYLLDYVTWQYPNISKPIFLNNIVGTSDY